MYLTADDFCIYINECDVGPSGNDCFIRPASSSFHIFNIELRIFRDLFCFSLILPQNEVINIIYECLYTEAARRNGGEQLNASDTTRRCNN